MKLAIALAGMLSVLCFAKNDIKIDNNHIFIKIKNIEDFPTSSLIKKVEHLFQDNYLLEVTDAKMFYQRFKKNPQFQKIEFSYHSGEKKLPTPEVGKFSPKGFRDYDSFNDPLARKIWSFADSSEGGISIDKAYQKFHHPHKEEIIVAVVDTGVDYTHEDLKNNMWVNTAEIPNNNIDDDNNGYIDDIYGIDAIENTGDPMAAHPHGTHVAGTIGAVQNNDLGIAGIAEKVKIMAIRAVPSNADETDADIVKSFLYAAKNGAKLINCSFGKNHNEGGMIVNETIDFIGKKYGVLVIAAAGNDYGRDIDDSPVYPGSFASDYLMVVASTTKSGRLSFFSNVGKNNVDIAAPGSGIYSTVPGNAYANMSGTSMASPTTTGVAAEVLSRNPNLSPLQLKERLMSSATTSTKLTDAVKSGGRVDLYQALLISPSKK